MCRRPILRLSSLVLTALLFTGDAAGEEVSLPYRGIKLNANLVVAPGNALSDDVIVITPGSQALRATLSAPELVSATGMYYPFAGLISDTGTLSTMQGPVRIQGGVKDFSFTPEKVEQYKAALQSAGKKLVVKTYDAGHSFDKPESLNHDRCADEDAKRSTSKFPDLFFD